MPRRKRRVEEPPVIEGPEFQCSFQEMYEYMSLGFSSTEDRKETRFARYHGSNFWKIQGFGVSRWVIGGYLQINWQELMEQGLYRRYLSRLRKAPKQATRKKKVSKKNYQAFIRYSPARSN